MRELSAQEFALAIAISVSQHRTGMTREERARTEYVDDCLKLLDSPTLNPNIRLLGKGISRINDAKRARLCEETRDMYEAMAPVIRLLMQELEAASQVTAERTPQAHAPVRRGRRPGSA